MMPALTVCLVALPVVAALFLFSFRFRRESIVSYTAIATAALNSVILMAICVLWADADFGDLDIFFGTLLRSGSYHFDLSFQVDLFTVVFLGLISFITGIVVKYSQYYMHREPGYKRFFVHILVFVAGMNLVALAGTLDLLFAGWEIVGISSFVLIAFYRDRVQPSRHALRTYCVYRFCDSGLLLGAWLSHLVWHSSPTFSDLASDGMLSVLHQAGEWPLLGLSLLTLLAASGKSAQFPFTFWIPRAMEGPTPSSAVFYGALSVHAGAFLLMRMFPVWQSSYYAPFAVGGVGLLTVAISTVVGHAQSNIKGQIAYASSAQVGLIFVELAFGWRYFALFHLTANGLLRCFQLLVSPSIIAFVLRWQGRGGGRVHTVASRLAARFPRYWTDSIYVFCLNEGYLESLARLSFRTGFEFMDRCKPFRVWNAGAFMASVLPVCVWLLDPSALTGALLVLACNFVGWCLGRFALMRLERLSPGTTLNEYHGLVRRDPFAAACLFVGFLFLAGFPLSPGFLGADLLLHASVEIGVWSTLLLALVFVLTGLTLARVFVRVSFGGHLKYPMRWSWESSSGAAEAVL